MAKLKAKMIVRKRGGGRLYTKLKLNLKGKKA